MKKAIIAFLILCSIGTYASPVLNIKTDLSNYGLANIPGIAGDGAYSRIKAIIDYNHNTRRDSALILSFPDGSFLFDTSIQPQDNITFKLSSGTIWYSTSNSLFGAYNALFESIGHSNVKILGEPGSTITNYFSKYIYALVQFKADPRKCVGNEVTGVTLENSWCYAAIAGAGVSSDTNSTYWTDLTFCKDSILNIYNPSKPHILVGSDYGTNADCNGINILQAYHKVMIDGVVVINTGGDNIRGYGLNKGLSKDPECGIVEIKNFYLKNGNMNIEINGNYCPNLLNIHDGQCFYPQCVGGFNMSVEGKPLIIKNNYCLSADDCGGELSAYGGEISGNTFKGIAWRDTMQTFQHAAFQTGSSRTANVYLYGFLADIHDNTFACDTTGKGSSSPIEWNGISPVTRASNSDTAFGRASMAGLAYMGGQNIHHNTFIGQTHRVYDNTNDTTESVAFNDNRIFASGHYGTDELVTIKGYGMQVLRNTFNMKGSAAPTSGHAVVKRLAGYGEVVQDNTILNGAGWYSNSSGFYKFKQ